MSVEIFVFGRRPLPPHPADWGMSFEEMEGDVQLFVEPVDAELVRFGRTLVPPVTFEPRCVLRLSPAWELPFAVAETIALAVEGAVADDAGGAVSFDALGRYAPVENIRELEDRVRNTVKNPKPIYERWEREAAALPLAPIHPARPEEPVKISLSSGTTGLPKGAVATYGQGYHRFVAGLMAFGSLAPPVPWVDECFARISASPGCSSANCHRRMLSCSTMTDPFVPWISVFFSRPGKALVVASKTPSAPFLKRTQATPVSSTSIRSWASVSVRASTRA